MRIAATLFSLVALVAVSALLVLLAVGGEWPATPAAEESARVSQFADTERVPVPPPATESDQAPAVTGSIEAKRDASRIPSQGNAARPVGTVRAVNAQDVSAPMPQPAETSPPAASEQFQPTYFSAAPAVKESAAPTETAAAETGNNGVEPPARRPPAEPAAAARSAPVTTHVNLRAKPENDAPVVAVVPAKQNVKVVECTRWCEVVYGDKQGFVHRRFVTGAGG